VPLQLKTKKEKKEKKLPA